ncbi:hypothetical protein GEMRC1_013519 [Eukaryota sp. GEM-RC1]
MDPPSTDEIAQLCLKYNLSHDFQSIIPLEDRSAADVTAPFHQIPYEDQLKLKHFIVHQALCATSRSLRNSSKAIPPWARTIPEDTPVCPITEIIPAPEPITNYRNKAELSFGTNADSSSYILGFQAGPFKHRRFFDYNSPLLPPQFISIAYASLGSSTNLPSLPSFLLTIRRVTWGSGGC